MASKQTYPCFTCRKAGHEVFLDGKDEQGRTKYLNEDGTRHTHLGSGLERHTQPQQQSQQQGSTTIVSDSTQLTNRCKARIRDISIGKVATAE